MSDRPLFIPLKTEYYEAFESGEKGTEYRKYGPRWNEETCYAGRPVILSKGYGKHARINRVIESVEVKEMDSADWIACYGEPGTGIAIKMKEAVTHE